MESNSVPPPAPQEQRQAKGNDPAPSINPEGQLPTTNPLTDPAIRVTRGDIRVQQRERRCAEKWGECEYAEIPTKVLDSPDGRQDPRARGSVERAKDVIQGSGRTKC